MILVDANLLLYAYHPKAREQEASRAWLEATLSGSQLVRFASPAFWNPGSASGKSFERRSPRAGSRTAGDGRRLASLAIEHGATLYTTDREFSRFPGLAFTNTLLHARGDG